MIYTELQNIIGEMPTEFDPLYLVSCFIILMFFMALFKIIFSIFDR